MNNQVGIIFLLSLSVIGLLFLIIKVWKSKRIIEDQVKYLEEEKAKKEELEKSYFDLSKWKKDAELKLVKLNEYEIEKNELSKNVSELTTWKEETSKLIPEWRRKSDIVDQNIRLVEESADLEGKKNLLLTDIESMKLQLGELLEYQLLEESGVFNYKFHFQEINQYDDALAIIKESEKVLVKTSKAFNTKAKDLVGTPIMKSLEKISLLAFNSGADLITSNIKFNNYESCVSKLEKLFININNCLGPLSSEISSAYYEAKVKEMTISLEYEEEKQRIKQEQDDIKAQMREEQKNLQEAEKARDKAIEEEEKLEIALEMARKELEGKAEAERSDFEAKIKELEKQLEEAHQETERTISNAQITSVGHVYVISNLGSFGENIYKIGMTRRDDPMDRVRELGDASVPFRFDVHAMVFSDNARKLEADLHKYFDERRVNKINKRKEFFTVSLEEVEKACDELGYNIKLTKLAEAREYRESLDYDLEVA
ncbi:DUF4041 domain-containing protein [Halobacteriovorax sp. GB3]|uniref:DUF4041 domain-containing protein n=1 Tax=Halobacteriovorax sp. GB3 TaxID=2719615 RepID=UPI00235F7F95|nr:DUF4041 domain-containing protein [Halobacteriovorax sp. GB3]MDD0851610.1 DUF4041 domain-containing protein [Halobacteriovorax sp. GB3]